MDKRLTVAVKSLEGFGFNVLVRREGAQHTQNEIGYLPIQPTRMVIATRAHPPGSRPSVVDKWIIRGNQGVCQVDAISFWRTSKTRTPRFLYP